MTEQAVDIKTADGVADSHVLYPDGPGSWPAVIFFMDWLGIRAEMHPMARRLAAAGYLSYSRISITGPVARRSWTPRRRLPTKRKGQNCSASFDSLRPTSSFAIPGHSCSP